jgi:hypothetical protein
MTAEQGFEAHTWADAEVTPGPGNPAHPDHEAWLAEQDQDDEQADEPETDQEKSER